MFRKLDVFPSSGEGGKTPTQLGPLGRANLNLSKGPNWVGVFPPHLRTETYPGSETGRWTKSKNPGILRINEFELWVACSWQQYTRATDSVSVVRFGDCLSRFGRITTYQFLMVETEIAMKPRAPASHWHDRTPEKTSLYEYFNFWRSWNCYDTFSPTLS
jgi:hypothetical protein